MRTELANGKTTRKITYKKNIMDSKRIMASSLSNFVGNLTKGLQKNKNKDVKFCLEYV